MMLNTKSIRLTQQKYNLLREESEGYAKLITELNHPDLTKDNVKYVIRNVQALIGI